MTIKKNSHYNTKSVTIVECCSTTWWDTTNTVVRAKNFTQHATTTSISKLAKYPKAILESDKHCQFSIFLFKNCSNYLGQLGAYQCNEKSTEAMTAFYNCESEHLCIFKNTV